MTQARYAALGDVCTIAAGGTPSRTSPEFFNGGIPWVKIGDMAMGVIQETEETISSAGLANSSAKILPCGTVLISIFATIGRTAVLEIDAATNQAIAGVTPKEPSSLGSNYLRYFLDSKHAELNTLARGVAQPNINQRILKSLEIPLPLLSKQHRIVDLLSRAEGIIRLRREAHCKAAGLFPALFLAMFGDPATNPKRWPTVPFGQLGQLDRGKSRHRPRDAQELYGGPYPFVQTGDVANSGGSVTRYRQTYSEQGLAQSRLWPAGTLCITIAANIARTGVLGFDACFPDSVVGFTPSDAVTVDYIQQWLAFLQPTLEKNAPQAAQKNINLNILRNLPVPVPPIALQRQFGNKADAVRSIVAQQANAMATAQSTFDALLNQSFQR